MAFLVLAFLVSVFCADPSVDDIFDCSKITGTSALDGEAAAKCINTTWCVWNYGSPNGNSACVFDKCLHWVPDTDSTCPTVQGFPCTIKYMTDGFDCDDFTPIQTDRFCRSTINGAYGVGKVTDCAYQDIKAVGSTSGAINIPPTGRACGTKLCTWRDKDSVVGTDSTNPRYCAPSEDQDCSYFAASALAGDMSIVPSLCSCIGEKYCGLSPYCYVKSGACVADYCTFNDYASNETNTAECYDVVGDNLNSSCGIKRSWVLDNNNQRVQRNLCTLKSGSDANPCFGALKQTLKNVNIPSCDSTKYDCDYCDYYEYDEDTCNNAALFKSDGSLETDKFCKLVQIGKGYLTPKNGYYCTDGRAVPGPNAALGISVPTLFAFLLVVLSLLF